MKIIIYLVIISSFFACKKDLEFNLSGIVFDKSLQKSLEGGKITIKKVSADGSLNTSVLAEDQISSNGEFNLTFKREKALKFIITIEKDNYFSVIDEINFDELESDKPTFKVYEIYAKAWIKFHTKNNFPANSSDVFTFHFLEKVSNCAECCNDDKVYINGAVENIFYCIYEAGKTYNLRYIVSSPFEQSDFSITPVAFDTIEFFKAY